MSQAAPFSITASQSGGATVLHLAGVLDGTTSVELAQRLAGLLQQKGVRIVAELSQVRYVASAGVGALVNAHRRAKAVGGSVHLACPSDSLREIFTTLNLGSVLPIHDTLAQAVAG